MASTSTPGSSSELTITVEHNPSKSRLSELGINWWPKWVNKTYQFNWSLLESFSFFYCLPFPLLGTLIITRYINFFLTMHILINGSNEIVFFFFKDGVVLLGNSCSNSMLKRRVICWEGKWRFTQKVRLSLYNLLRGTLSPYPRELVARGTYQLQWTSITSSSLLPLHHPPNDCDEWW